MKQWVGAERERRCVSWYGTEVEISKEAFHNYHTLIKTHQREEADPWQRATRSCDWDAEVLQRLPQEMQTRSMVTRQSSWWQRCVVLW